MIWGRIGKAVISVLIGGAAGGGASTVVGSDPLEIAVSSIVTGLLTMVALFKRSPKDE